MSRFIVWLFFFIILVSGFFFHHMKEEHNEMEMYQTSSIQRIQR